MSLSNILLLSIDTPDLVLCLRILLLQFLPVPKQQGFLNLLPHLCVPLIEIGESFLRVLNGFLHFRGLFFEFGEAVQGVGELAVCRNGLCFPIDLGGCLLHTIPRILYYVEAQQRLYGIANPSLLG